MAYQKELVGDQENLPEELKAKIEAAPAKQKKQIKGYQTFEAEKNKNKDQFELGLSLDGGSADPMDTKDRLIIKKSDNQKNNMGKPLSKGDFIEQMEKMTIKKDSVGGSGNTYYSLNKPKKKKK
mgnify:FL=1